MTLTLLPPILAWAVRALASTWRIRTHMAPGVDPRLTDNAYIYVFWHESVLTIIGHWRDHPIQGMASQSFDGTLITKVMQHLGYPPVARGSSSRGGGEALGAHVDALKRGLHVSLTPDGPRGPAYVAKRGVVQLAILTGKPVVAVACASPTGWRLRNWDRTQVPPPFSRLNFVLGTPVNIATLDPETALQTVQQALETVQREALDFGL